jgi:hypothetical protein
MTKIYGKLWWGFAILIIFPGTSLSEPSFERQSPRSRQVFIVPPIWVGGGLSYFPFYIQLLYPEIPGLYPCFPYGSCTVLHPFQKYERRKERLKPEPVFRHGEPLVDDEAMEAWRASLRQAVEPFRTNEQQIVPTFREHSLIRSKYQNAGNVLPEFLVEEESKSAEDDENMRLNEYGYPDTSLLSR